MYVCVLVCVMFFVCVYGLWFVGLFGFLVWCCSVCFDLFVILFLCLLCDYYVIFFFIVFVLCWWWVCCDDVMIVCMM